MDATTPNRWMPPGERSGSSSTAPASSASSTAGAAPAGTAGPPCMIAMAAMDDPAYKQMFSRPRMVRDLLHGFAARGWSGALDFASLTPVPASFVSDDLQQRHGDLVWRVRFRDDRWLYLVLLLEFQSGVDRAMAVRMLAYTALLYQKLIGEGVLREHDALPPVLPIVILQRSPTVECGGGRLRSDRVGRCRAGPVSAVAAVLPVGRESRGGWRSPSRQSRVGADRT